MFQSLAFDIVAEYIEKKDHMKNHSSLYIDNIQQHFPHIQSLYKIQYLPADDSASVEELLLDQLYSKNRCNIIIVCVFILQKHK